MWSRSILKHLFYLSVLQLIFSFLLKMACTRWFSSFSILWSIYWTCYLILLEGNKIFSNDYTIILLDIMTLKRKVDGVRKINKTSFCTSMFSKCRIFLNANEVNTLILANIRVIRRYSKEITRRYRYVVVKECDCIMSASQCA